MQTFLNLMWREFHELKWTVAAALAIVTAAPPPVGADLTVRSHSSPSMRAK